VNKASARLAQQYDAEAARRRLAEDVERIPRPRPLRRPRINTFRPYDPTRPLRWDHRVTHGATVDDYVDAPDGESFWVLLIGALILAFFGWLAWVINTAV